MPVGGFVLSVVVLALWSATARAQEEQPQVDPQAERVLRQMSEFFSNVESLEVEAVTSTQIVTEDLRRESTSPGTVAIQRPNKLHLEQKADENGAGGVIVVSDGENVYSYLSTTRRYVVQKAPPRIDPLMAELAVLTEVGAIVGPLMFADPYHKLLEGANAARYVGTEEVEGTQYHRIRLLHDEVDLDIFVEKSERPVIRRVVPDLSRQLAATEGMQDVQVEMAVEMANWLIDQPIPDDRFAFAPPADAEQVQTLGELLGADAQAGGPAAAGEHPLVGQPAPDVELDMIDGRTMNLRDHRGQVVILDFWATWCVPCIVAMPMLMEVAEEYRDRGVVLYAINKQEPPEQVRPFIEQRGWDLKVPLDRTGRVAGLYHERGLPHTVIIGKDGTVKAVKVGFRPDMRQLLRQELDPLVQDEADAEPAPN